MDAAALLAALERNAAVTTKEVTLPGIGAVFIRASTIADVEAEAESGAARAGLLSRRLIRLLCDERGEPLLDASNPAHVAVISKQPESVLTRLSQASRDLDGTSEKGAEALGNG